MLHGFDAIASDYPFFIPFMRLNIFLMSLLISSWSFSFSFLISSWSFSLLSSSPSTLTSSPFILSPWSGFSVLSFFLALLSWMIFSAMYSDWANMKKLKTISHAIFPSITILPSSPIASAGFASALPASWLSPSIPPLSLCPRIFVQCCGQLLLLSLSL